MPQTESNLSSTQAGYVKKELPKILVHGDLYFWLSELF